MKKRKIILISVLIIIILAVISVFLPVSVDKFLWEDNFEKYVIDKYMSEFEYQIAKRNVGWIEGKSRVSYYYQSEDGTNLDIIDIDTDVFDGEKAMIDSVSYSGRKIYMSVFFEYEGKIHEIKFEGTRWFFGQYSWKMLDNEFFPIKDENFINTPEVVYKKP